MRLYHLSTDPNLTTMTPRIPPYNRIKIGFENGITKRVCFAPTIKNALSAVPSGKPGVVHYIYVAVSPDPKFIYKPTSNDVPEAGFTHEIWYLKSINVKKVGVLIIGDKFDPWDFSREVLHGKRIFTSRLYRKNYKRFKKLPDEEEKREYLASQKELSKDLAREEFFKKLKRIFALPTFVLSGGSIKKV